MAQAKVAELKGDITPKPLLFGFIAVVVLLIIAMLAAIVFTVFKNRDTEQVLTDSVKAELIVSSISARGIIDDHIQLFKNINSAEDIRENWDEWIKVVGELQNLNYIIGGQYIYVLKEIDDQFYFVFDTDPEIIEAQTFFLPYELSYVHEAAFGGVASAGIENVTDEWGTFNTAAVPLFDGHGDQIGIVATDFLNTYIEQNRQASSFYTTALIVTTAVTMVLLLLVLILLVRFNARAQRHLFNLANYDPISGLPNRNYLFSYLREQIDSIRENNYPFAVIFYDLDNFKTVNDEAGHDSGDELLRTIANCIRSFAENSEYASVNGFDALAARIGGDEFLNIIPGISTPEEASAYARSLLDHFAIQPELQDFIADFGVGMSIGIALFPSMHTDYDELIKYADIAMYYAKHGGKSDFRIYDPSMGDDVEDAELITRKEGRSSRGKNAPPAVTPYHSHRMAKPEVVKSVTESI